MVVLLMIEYDFFEELELEESLIRDFCLGYKPVEWDYRCGGRGKCVAMFVLSV